MRTIDLRYEDDFRRPGGRYSLSLSVVLEEEDACTDACPDKSSVEEKLTILVGPPPSPPSKLRVIEAVMAFALAMRRRLLATKTA
ncbi:hypothetical protein EUX98_g762 [Antrodiella citrinella]|uniref:Uncharacterized protein n=1 Tax=Antrodiella citrinella TaxID=2447956 RepID=A0A4S4N6A8_9APHY|nr:hypothetical protein EUX98_g762 [Antrodiella citrinella]